MSREVLLDFYFSPSLGALEQPMLLIEDVHALEVERQAHERPFACGGGQAAQRELPKAEDLFDDSNDGLHRAFSQSIDRMSDLGSQFIRHLDDGAGVVC